MRQAAKQIFIWAVLLLVFCILCRFTLFRTYTLHFPLERFSGSEISPDEPPQFSPETPDSLRFGEAEIRNNTIHIPVFPNQRGELWIDVLNKNNEIVDFQLLQVDAFGTVYNKIDGSFNGDTVVLAATAVFWLVTTFIMIWHFRRQKGWAFYSYASIYYSGFSVFSLFNFIQMLLITISRLNDPARYSMVTAYRSIQQASPSFMTLTMPLVLAFALAMIISNIALLFHNRPRIQNVLGLGIGLALIIGEVIGFYLSQGDFAGSREELRIRDTLTNVYATAFVYFECMLTGAVYCGTLAARHEPPLDRDFILILGCWFRPDGTLPPLLRGRADRAIAFWKKQKKASGKEAVFIPTGGMGMDEPTPEAEAISNYLLQQGIPGELILPERESLNTLQNMQFSRKIIDRENPQGKVAFSTTNYHVFRSGIYADDAGLKAEGMGSKTIWWFWPNAFMREVIGLLQKRWKQELLFMLALILFFCTLSMVLD